MPSSALSLKISEEEAIAREIKDHIEQIQNDISCSRVPRSDLGYLEGPVRPERHLIDSLFRRLKICQLEQAFISITSLSIAAAQGLGSEPFAWKRWKRLRWKMQSPRDSIWTWSVLFDSLLWKQGIYQWRPVRTPNMRVKFAPIWFGKMKTWLNRWPKEERRRYCFSKSFLRYNIKDYDEGGFTIWPDKSQDSGVIGFKEQILRDPRRYNEQLLKIEKEYDLPDQLLETPSSLKEEEEATLPKK